MILAGCGDAWRWIGRRKRLKGRISAFPGPSLPEGLGASAVSGRDEGEDPPDVPGHGNEGDVPAPDGAGLSKSATSRRFVALSAARMKAWMETRLDDLDLLAIQIDGIHMDEDMLLVAAIGVDANGDKHPLGLVEGATENGTTVQALIDNLVERGLDPTVRRLFIIDGAKALSKAIRRTFGRDTAIQRCQIHKA